VHLDPIESRLQYMNMTTPSSTVPSPCVRNCCLDDDLICLGCFRSLDEIKEWSMVEDDRRNAILQNASERKSRRRQLYPGFDIHR
jgi:predicted Fe-S protein YdhL (DUF1289 family)